VLALGVLPLFRAEGAWRERLKHDLKFLIGLGVGVGAGVAIHAAFNQLRFGMYTNTFLLDPQLQVPTVGEHLFQLAGLWVAPNGGLLFFAPLATLTLVAIAWVSWRQKAPLLHRLAGLVPFALMLVATLGFARWFSPYGWWTWGPRLCLPWVAPLLLAALALEPGRFEAGLRRALEPLPIALVTTAVLIAVALPHLAMLPAADLFYGFFAGNAECPHPVDVRAGTPDLFYACTNAMAFPQQDFVLLKPYAKLDQPNMRVAAALYAALLAGLSLWLRREAIDPRRS
jgi:hypothetical protein